MIYEHGAAAMAMAGAFTSLAKDPSALWHNPAGMAWLEGTQILGGATFIIPSGSVDFPDYPGSPPYNQEKALFTPPNLYLTHQLSKKAVIGLGVFAPYGLGITWPEPETLPLALPGDVRRDADVLHQPGHRLQAHATGSPWVSASPSSIPSWTNPSPS